MVEKQNPTTGAWETYASGTQAGLLDLLYVLGEGLTADLNGLTQGNYRVTANEFAGLAALSSVTINGELTTYNPHVLGGYESVEATGDVTTDPAVTVTSVEGGTPGTAVTGDYGSLTLNADGTYTYTPTAAASSIGKVDTFAYELSDGTNGTLVINIDSNTGGLVWGAPGEPATITLTAVADEGTAVVNTDYFDAPVSLITALPVASSTSAANVTATRGFTVEVGSDYNLTINVSAVNNLPTESLTISLYNVTTGTSTAIATLTDTILIGNFSYTGAVPAGLAAGDYEVRVQYSKASSFALGYGNTINVSVTGTAADVDTIIGTTTTAASGNIFTDGDDSGVVQYTKIMISADGGTTFTEVAANGSIVAGDYGTLTIGSDGAYTYAVTGGVNAIGQVEEFSYKLVHPTGVESNVTTLSIDIDHGTGPAPAGVASVASFALFDEDVSAEDSDPTHDQSDSDGGSDLDLSDDNNEIDLDALGVPESDPAPGTDTGSDTGTLEDSYDPVGEILDDLDNV